MALRRCILAVLNNVRVAKYSTQECYSLMSRHLPMRVRNRSELYLRGLDEARQHRNEVNILLKVKDRR